MHVTWNYVNSLFKDKNSTLNMAINLNCCCININFANMDSIIAQYNSRLSLSLKLLQKTSFVALI